MNEFSLEKIAEKIHYGKSKEYFSEVLSSYHNNNLRSAVVMLWSVAVCDIVFKLQNLVDLYSDAQAKLILEQSTSLQQSDPKSSQWEMKLVDDTFKNTNLLDTAEHENLRYLQKQRHLSAHPVLDQNRALHTPNKETVRSLIRNTLEGVLLKPPFYTQKIFGELLEDIAENSSALNSKEKVKKYIESRYLNRLSPKVEMSIFRSLWKIVFKLDNEDCEKNRLINLQAIEVIGVRNKSLLQSEITGEIDFYSNIASNGSPLSFLVFFLAKNRSLYELLNEDAKLKIQHCIETDRVGKTLGWFTKNSLEEHFNNVVEWIEGDDYPSFDEGQWNELLEISDSEEWQQFFCKIVSSYYGASGSFNAADSRFKLILQFLKLFDDASLIFLLEKIEANNQTYWRGNAMSDHPKIKEKIIQKIGEHFNFEDYPHFNLNIQED